MKEILRPIGDNMTQPAPKLISVMTPCFNEEGNVRDLYEQVRAVFDSLPQYTYEHIFIDNASTDRTVEILKEIAAGDKRVKIIVNSRNFGHIRSPFHGLLQSGGRGRHLDGRRPPGPAGTHPRVSLQVGAGLQDGPWHQGRQRRGPAAIRRPQALLQRYQPPGRDRADRELHRLWPLRQSHNRTPPRKHRPVPVFSRDDLRYRL